MKKYIIAALYGGAIGWIIGTVIRTEIEHRKIRKRIKETHRMIDEIDKAFVDIFDDNVVQEPDSNFYELLGNVFCEEPAK